MRFKILDNRLSHNLEKFKQRLEIWGNQFIIKIWCRSFLSQNRHHLMNRYLNSRKRLRCLLLIYIKLKLRHVKMLNSMIFSSRFRTVSSNLLVKIQLYSSRLMQHKIIWTSTYHCDYSTRFQLCCKKRSQSQRAPNNFIKTFLRQSQVCSNGFTKFCLLTWDKLILLQKLSK